MLLSSGSQLFLAMSSSIANDKNFHETGALTPQC